MRKISLYTQSENPVERASAEHTVRERTRENAILRERYLGLNIAAWAEELDRAVKTLSIDTTTLIMAEEMCRLYLEQFGEPYPITEKTVAYEIEYHVDTYLYAVGKKGYFLRRNLTSWIFPKRVIRSHCDVVDIYVRDRRHKPWEGAFYEEILFGYRRGRRK